MNFTGAAIFFVIIAAAGVTLWGLFTKQRSVVIGVVAAAVAVLATVGAWYAWAESRSIPWTVGYAVLVAASLASAARQCIGGGSVGK